MKRFIPFLFLATTAHASFCGGYSFQRIVTISTASQSVVENETNFPVIITTNDVTLSTTSGTGHLANSNGFDLIFSTDTSCNFMMNWDTETINNTGTNNLNVWINVPVLSTNTIIGTTFYMTYGNAGITTYQGHSTATWDSNFLGVWHMPNGTALDIKDSTANGFGGTNFGPCTATTGQIDGGNACAGGNFISTTLTNVLLNMTACTWFKTTTSLAAQRLIDKNYAGGFWVGENVDTPSDTLWGGGFEHASDPYGVYVTLSPDNTWHMICGRLSGGSGGTWTIIGDGGAVTASESLGYINTDTTALAIAATAAAASGFNGSEDEIEISNIGRSNGWIQDAYNNQKNSTTFSVIGAEQGGTVAVLPSNTFMSIKGGKFNIKGGKVTIK